MEQRNLRRTVFLTALWIAGIWLALWFLGPVLLPFAVGLLTALAADPIITGLQQRFKLPRWASAGLGVAGVYLLLSLLLAILCRLLCRELTAFVRALPSILTALSDMMTNWEAQLLTLSDRLPEGIAQVFTKTVTETIQNGSGIAEKLYDWLFSFASHLLKAIPDLLLFLLTAVLSGFMLAAELPKLRKLWQKKAPALWQQRGRMLFSRLKQTLGGWLKAQIKLMCISALVLTVGFLILQIDYPLLFGLAIALVDALPALGTGLILIPWSLFMFLQGNTFLGAGLLCLYAAAALIRTALEPRMLGKQMGLDPLLTLLSLYGGYRLLGIWGMILFPIGAITLKQFWAGTENRPID